MQANYKSVINLNILRRLWETRVDLDYTGAQSHLSSITTQHKKDALGTRIKVYWSCRNLRRVNCYHCSGPIFNY